MLRYGHYIINVTDITTLSTFLGRDIYTINYLICNVKLMIVIFSPFLTKNNYEINSEVLMNVK